jgi:hypothetical protein
MKAAKGHVPLSTNAGSANTWFPDGPPRPDRKYNTLLWNSFGGFGSAIGLTDFYLRSPLTGLLKVALAIIAISTAPFTKYTSFIPLFVLGFWEFLHIWTEKDRVVNYGLSAPFDLWHGIGQGMITNKDTNYVQKSNYTVWQVASILGFTGADAFLTGKPILGLRKLFDTVFFLGYITLVIYFSLNSVRDNLGLIILFSLLAVGLGVFVVPIYYMTLTTALSSPNNLFKKSSGSTDGSILGIYNFSKLWTSWIGSRTTDHVDADFGIQPPGGDYYRDMFQINYQGPNEKKTPQPKSAPSSEMTIDTLAQEHPMLGRVPLRGVVETGLSISKMTPVLALLLGPLTPGIITTLLSFIPMFIMPTGIISFKHMIELAYGIQDVADRKEGVDILKVLRNVPGLSTVLDAAGAAESIASAGAAAAGNLASAGAAAGMRGGARRTAQEPSLSTEAVALGATVAALIAGGAIKLAVDSLVTK